MARKKIPLEVEFRVLSRSRRRCAFCFGLNRDADQKPGQIAHIDQDRRNNALENLVYLCLVHHDAYDSRTSQSKGLAPIELVRYRDELDRFIEQNLAFDSPGTGRPGSWSDVHEEALEFFTGTHRSQAVVRILETGPRTLAALNRQIPPCDLEFTRAVVADILAKGWAEKVGAERFALTNKARCMLAALETIPEGVLEDAWRDAWSLPR